MYQYNPILFETRLGLLGKLSKPSKIRDAVAGGLKATRKGHDRYLIGAIGFTPIPGTGPAAIAWGKVPNNTRAKIYRDIIDTPGKTTKRGWDKVKNATKHGWDVTKDNIKHPKKLKQTIKDEIHKTKDKLKKLTKKLKKKNADN